MPGAWLAPRYSLRPAFSSSCPSYTENTELFRLISRCLQKSLTSFQSRSKLTQLSSKAVGRLEINFAKRIVKLDEAVVDLTTNEFAALALLVTNKGKVLNRDQILVELRGIESDAFNRSVDITMSRLRHKLRDDPKKPSFIKTVWATGYMFIEDEDQHES